MIYKEPASCPHFENLEAILGTTQTVSHQQREMTSYLTTIINHHTVINL